MSVERDPELVAALEALLFATGSPLSSAALAEALGGRDADEVRDAAVELRRRAEEAGRGVQVVEVAGGWQLRTHPRFAEAVVRLLGGRPAKLSRAALEVLAIVAYEQPVTRTRVEEVRGVRCGRVLRSLLERGLIRAAGRRDEPGRPLQYATTRAFLELYGLPGLSELPTLAERADLDDG